MSPTTVGGHSFTIAGSVHPVSSGWLVVAAKMRGGSLVPDLPRVFPDLVRALEGRPRFDAVGLNVAVGDPELAKSGSRACDLACKALLGHNPKVLRRQAGDPSLRSVMKQRRREAKETIGSRHQRTVFEYLPELSLFQATSGAVFDLQSEEHLALALEALATVPGVERVLEAELDGVLRIDLVRAALGLWTARRVIARIAVWIPEDPTLSNGLRVELLR